VPVALYQTSAAGPLPAFTGVYVFGDSLVDPGNALKAAKFLDDLPFTSTPDRAPTADKGYFLGRFSDGYTFADLVSNKLIGLAQKATFPYGFEDPLLGIPITIGGRPDGINLSFAYGGAQAIRGKELVPDLDEQTDAYRNYPAADPNALYIITVGGNDVRELVPRSDVPVTGATATNKLKTIAAEIADEVAQLYQFGARHVLITGSPDVGLIPYYAGSADEAGKRGLASEYSTRLDALVRTALEGLTLPAGAALHGYSLNAFADRLAASPASYGLTDLTHARTLVQAGALAPVGSGFLFFDDVHPSAQAHALAAADILASLGGTPEATVTAQSGPRVFAAVEAQGGSDSFSAMLVAGQSYTIDALGISRGDGTLADPRITVLAPGGAVVAQDDDGGLGLNARLQFVAGQTGAYTVQVAGVGVTTGSYVLQGPDLRGTNVRVEGSAAADTLGADAGSNTLRGNDGADSIVGGSGFDDINGNTGADYARGGAGDDWAVGGQDNDKLYGEAGNDLVLGNLGHDLCDGGAGNDTVRGGQGNDLVRGGDGADWLAGDIGSDTLTGGSGADIFHTFGETGLDRVTDFSLLQGDRVNVAAGTTWSVAQVGSDAVVSLSGGGQMVLVGVSAASLTSGWIF
jgi:Ca2+-binding RTX toxin-like protein